MKETEEQTARRMGIDWAEHHHAMPSQPEPVRYGNLTHDAACARRWRELTGHWPSWYESRGK